VPDVGFDRVAVPEEPKPNADVPVAESVDVAVPLALNPYADVPVAGSVCVTVPEELNPYDDVPVAVLLLAVILNVASANAV
jgi:hypothetical protein